MVEFNKKNLFIGGKNMLDKHLIAQTRPKADPQNMVLWKDFRVTVLADRLFRVERDAEKIFCDEATEAVWFRDMPPVPFKAEKNETVAKISTAYTELVLHENIDDCYVILGGKKIALDNAENLKGTYTTLDACDGGDLIEKNGSLTPIKLDMGVISRNGVAVLDYTRSSVLTSDGMLRKQRQDSLDLYVFAYGKDYRAAVRAFYMICGSTPKLPRFSLGNWWSRYYAYTEKEYLNVIDRLADRDIPVTVATVGLHLPKPRGLKIGETVLPTAARMESSM
jgi:alpha-glucosidase (family GH31 glycosyl hydrolase)